MDRILEGGNYGWDAETSVRSSQRHRGCAADAKSEAQLIGALPDSTMRHEHCGNAGAVESVESQEQASHSFHEPLGNLANTKRDSHIPTAPATKAMGKWKTKSRFSTFPPPRGYIGKTNEKPRRAGFAPRPSKTTEHQRKETCPGNLDVAIFRLTPHWNRTAVSGSWRIGINSRFQAHLWIGICSGAKPTPVSTTPNSRLSPGAKNVWSTAISTMAAAPAARTGGDSRVYVPGAG